MNIEVGQHIVKILNSNPINEKEIDISKCYFEFDEDITNDYVKEAYFTLNNHTYKQIITNNQCDIPYEVLTQKGELEIGVVAYLVENEEEIKRYNPSPDYFTTWKGSLKDADNSEPITPSDKEQIEQQLLNISTQMDNIDIEASKEEHTTTITITHKDGEEQEVQILDGEKGEKGDKGDAGSIKMIIVQALPTEDIDESAIYLLPLENPTEEGNNYAEYIYVNNQWELLGKIGVQVDLTDYVKNTDYATNVKGGVIKTPSTLGISVGSTGNVFALSSTYADYGNRPPGYFIGKETLDNVITGKGLVSNTDYASASVGGVIKTTIGNQLQVNSSGELTSRVVAYSSYGNILENAFISKGTLDNVLTAKIGDIQTLLDNLNNGGGVQ
jgi:hypothetical protein